MRSLLLIVFVLIYFASTSQVYLKLNPTPESSPGACDAAIDVEFVGATPPYEIHWWDDSWQVSNGMRAENLCSGKRYTVTFLDSNCFESEVAIYIHPDPTKQIYPGYINFTLPTTSSSCDGTVEFNFHNTSEIVNRRLNMTWTSDSIFTGRCVENEMTYMLVDASNYNQYIIQWPYRLTNPTPCNHFQSFTNYTEPSISGTGCDASIIVTNIGLVGNADYYIYNSPIGGGSVQVNNYWENFADSVCWGPYLSRVLNTGNKFYTTALFYIPEPGTQINLFWNIPDSLPPIIDTIVLSSLLECGPAMQNGIDSAYISDLYLIGNGQYHFTITAIAGNDTVNYFNAAMMDTTHGNIIQLVAFCEDTTRSNGTSIKNNLYIGPDLSAPDAIKEIWQDKLSLYPNPANQSFVIGNLPEGTKNIQLLNLTGAILNTQTSSSTQLEFNTSSLSEGYYLLRITNEKNQTAVKKVIIIRDH